MEASRGDAEWWFSLIVPGQDAPVAPVLWSYGQLCSLVSGPAAYMRQLRAPLAGINLQHSLLLRIRLSISSSAQRQSSPGHLGKACLSPASCVANEIRVLIAQDLMPHSSAQTLPWGHGTFAHFTSGACDTLILMVHGFGGGAANTWTGMQSLIEDSEFAVGQADVVSYGYDSTNTPAANSAVLLRDFINAIVDNHPAWSSAAARAGRTAVQRNYAHIFVVAHSLGAPVARRALLDAIESRDRWPARTRLVLFAPAHMGTRLLNDQNFLTGGLGGIVSTILVGFKLGRPALDDLKPDSPFLNRLSDDTKRYIAEGWEESLKAKRVVFGAQEKVVRVDRFCNDPIQVVWPRHNHVSICKVAEAATFVREALV
ncbi:esterase/lipase family protein [Sphingomonas sp. GB1N7]|uniref:esterase/lipase family protein n=1 Tax=Parasphingomonas caseinilytica TaxID=3096158 RepID=UPI002FC5BB8B